jgi:hypothetical protein
VNEQIVTIGDHQIGLDLEDGDVIADVMVLARVVRLDGPGKAVLVVGASDHTDYIVQLGLLAAANDAAGEADEEGS